MPSLVPRTANLVIYVVIVTTLRVFWSRAIPQKSSYDEPTRTLDTDVCDLLLPGFPTPQNIHIRSNQRSFPAPHRERDGLSTTQPPLCDLNSLHMFSRSNFKFQGPKEPKRSGDKQVELLRELGLVGPLSSSSRSGASGRRNEPQRPAYSSGAIRSFTGAIFPEKSEFAFSLL